MLTFICLNGCNDSPTSTTEDKKDSVDTITTNDSIDSSADGNKDMVDNTVNPHPPKPDLSPDSKAKSETCLPTPKKIRNINFLNKSHISGNWILF